MFGVGCIFIYTPSCLQTSTQERKSFANICAEHSMNTHAHSLAQCITCVNSVFIRRLRYCCCRFAPVACRFRCHRRAALPFQPFSSQIPFLSHASKSKRDLISHYHYLCYYIIFKLNNLAAFIHKEPPAVCTNALYIVGPFASTNIVMGPNAIKNRFYSFNFFVYMTKKRGALAFLMWACVNFEFVCKCGMFSDLFEKE